MIRRAKEAVHIVLSKTEKIIECYGYDSQYLLCEFILKERKRWTIKKKKKTTSKITKKDKKYFYLSLKIFFLFSSCFSCCTCFFYHRSIFGACEPEASKLAFVTHASCHVHETPGWACRCVLPRWLAFVWKFSLQCGFVEIFVN